MKPGTYKGGQRSAHVAVRGPVAKMVTPQETDAESADSACEDVHSCRVRQHTATTADTARGAACLGKNSGHRGVGMQVDWV